jgi:F0F1-type ATP synthase assembly protein I
MPFNRPIPDSQQPSKSPSPLASLVQAERMVQIAILLPTSAFVGWIIGAWLDKVLHQSWITLIGILFGGFSGLYYVIRLVMAQGRRPQSGTTSADPTPPNKP